MLKLEMRISLESCKNRLRFRYIFCTNN